MQFYEEFNLPYYNSKLLKVDKSGNVPNIKNNKYYVY